MALRFRNLGISACLALFLTAAPAFAVQYSPILDAQLLGGQYFFESQESSLAGNVAVSAASAVKFNDQWSVIPSLSAAWRGTKSVQDLVGGGTIFQQTQDHNAAVKGIYSPNEAWQFKAGGAYHLELLKETKDETWGKGLFDYQKPSANLELERSFGKDASVRAGLDYYWIDFRNFSSLESQQRDLGRENASAKTLNTYNLAPYLAVQWPLPFLDGQKARLGASYFYTFRSYSDQTIVLPSGSLAPDSRQDTSQIATLDLALPFVFSDDLKLVSIVAGAYSLLYSNQNNYDAAKTQFNPDYYAYREFTVGPSLNFLVGPKPMVYAAGFSYVRRNYADRPVQDGDGTYGGDRIHTDEYYANFSVAYPINKNFKVQASGNFGWSRSNMTYEKTYRYNYTTATYLAGVVFNY